MRRTVRAMMSVLMVLIISLAVPASAAAQENTLPRLTSISFKNAVIDGSFHSDIMNYTITLQDNTVSPTLESYRLSGDCQLFIGYSYNEINQQTGITATIEYPTGSTIYTFTYANPAEYEKNSNNYLAELSYAYGELVPQLNSEDTEYTLYIPSDLTNLVMSPVPEDINAHCSQSPIDITLKEGQELWTMIDCIASDGSVRQYKINIVRAEKSLAEVKKEIQETGEVSLVKGTRFYEKTEFFVILISVLCGIAILTLLYKLTRKIALNPYDTDELPFFDESEESPQE